MKKAVITINGLQALDDTDGVELVTEGEYEYTPGRSEFRYTESELTGLEGTDTDFVIEDGVVTMTRVGELTATIVFDRSHKHYFVYNTPFGNITMGVETFSLSSELDEHGGNVEIIYVITIDNQTVSRNHFVMNIKVIK